MSDIITVLWEEKSIATCCIFIYSMDESAYVNSIFYKKILSYLIKNVKVGVK